MPTVRKGARQVSTMALPGIRLTAAETPESRGAGLAIAKGRTTEAIGELGGTVGTLAYHEYSRMQQEERQKADDVALLAAKNKKDAWQLARVYDPQTGALRLKGSDAFTLPEDVDQDLAKINSEIEQGFGNTRQKLAWERMKAQDDNNVRLTIARHVAGQREAFDAAEFDGGIKNKHSLAIANALDPARLSQELADGEQMIKTRGDRLGLGPEAIAEQTNAFRSDIHVGVIANLLANEQTAKAQHYFAETRDQISGDKLDEVTRALSVGNTRKQAQEETAKILAAGGTLAEQRAKAKQIDDPDVQDEVLSRIEHEEGIRQAQVRQTEENNLNNAYNIVSQTHDTSKIPPQLWASLGAHQPGLESYARGLGEGKPVKTNLDVFYRLMEQASTDPQGFLNENLLSHRYELSEGDFEQLTGLRSSIRAADARKTDEALGGFRTKDDILTDTLTQYGIDPKSKAGSPEAQAIAQLRRMLDQRVEAAQQPDEGGKRRKVTNDEIQTTLDDLLSQSRKVPGSWWNIWPGGKPFYDTTKRLIDLRPADIPATDRADLERALRARNRPVTDQTVLDLYLEMQVR